jgi:hypothetical protein
MAFITPELIAARLTPGDEKNLFLAVSISIYPSEEQTNFYSKH